MIGVGAMIGAGIFVLTGIAAGVSGPASILAFALNGAVTLLTAFAYAELAAAIPEAGGGYAFVRRAFPGVVGFTAGWLLWFAYTVACSLYALGFAGYFWEFFIRYAPGLSEFAFALVSEHGAILGITLLVAVLFVRLNARGSEVTGQAENFLTVSKLVVLGVFIIYGFRAVLEAPDQAARSFSPFFPQGFGGVIVAMGLTFIAFEGYDLIATVAEEIKEPEKNIPKAIFISLAITVVMYLLILFVALAAAPGPDGQPSWQSLGDYGETAIVRAAEGFMPSFGVALIVFGGLLSTMSALNATVMASSRVAFSMGRDRLLPDAMAKIHPERRTPHIAIVVTGVILLAMALTLPIEAVGSAASLIFLLTFAMVNLSVIVLRRKAPELNRRYKVPFYPVVPILGIVLNLFLAVYQFTFQPLAWYVTIGWIVLGLIVYYSYSAKRAAEVQPQVLEVGVPALPPGVRSVVVPLHNPDHVYALLDYAVAMASARSLDPVAISVVEVPRQLPIREGLRFVPRKEPLLYRAKEHAAMRQSRLTTDMVVANRASDGILSSVGSHNGDLLVMGWKGYTNTGDRVFGEVADRIIRHAPCDIALIKLASTDAPRRCLFPTAGGPNATFAGEILNALADQFKMSITICHVVEPGATAEERAEAEGWIARTRERIDADVELDQQIIEAKTVAGGIAKASRDYDLVVLGATREPWYQQVLFGEIAEKVARYSPASVLVAKRYEGRLRSMLKKAFG
ncbi:MAG: amino acid transporter/nucleotide-binding universal stress UspA family protein [Myxococcota bacterium]|jgi:amino acid transporter/nucleotide-binding universal stress UspA family protein